MNLNALAFLKAVLPDGGWYASWTKGERRSYNTLFPSIEALAQHIELEDARGLTVYHACASFKDPRGIYNPQRNKKEVRTQENAWGAKSLWLDIDAGKKDSPYATAVDAAQAVFRFTRDTVLPPPIFVGSGYGIHCYWPLTTSLEPADWLELAAGLKGAAIVHGLHADPSRTTDLASVLRTPGTHNRKFQNIQLVEVGPLVGPYDPEHFDSLIPYGARAPVRVEVQQSAGPDISPLTQALIVEPDYAPVHANDVADQCAQLRWMRDAKGSTPEPHWYACLGVLSRCVDGEETAHAWSSGHQHYSEKETTDKYNRTLALTGATTCAKFESVNPAGCQSCPFRGRITSPISLRQVSTGAVHVGVDQWIRTTPITSTTVFKSENETASILPVLPVPFEWTAASQLVCMTEKGDNSVPIVLSQYPLYLAGIGVGEVRGDRFSFHFRQWLPHRGWFDIYIAAGKLFGPGGTSELAERGATIHDAKLFLNYARAAADQFHSREKLKMQYDQCGWKDDYSAFLVGDALYTIDGVQENVTVSPELHTRAQWLGPQTGTLEGWSGAANALFAAGCEAQSFALACAFAAPLMRLQATDEGGAVVNLLSRGSGTGKTTALAAVTSAWGRKQGLSLTKIDTRVAQAITLGVLGNIPCIYDELGSRDPLIIREFITMFTNGRDKMRGTADGSIQHTQAAWQTLMVSGSNQSIHDILAHSGGSDALAFRILEFVCQLPPGVVAAKGDALRKDMEANAGWAGDTYIDYLMQPGVLPWVRDTLTRRTAELWEKSGNRPEHRFWMRTIGAVAVASALVNEIGILQFNSGRIVDWAVQNVGRSVSFASPQTHVQNSVGTFGEFLSAMLDTVLVVNKAYSQGQRHKDIPRVVPRRELQMRYELEGKRLLVAEKAFREWLLTKEIGSREVLDDLERVGIVSNRRRFATLSAGTDLVGAQQACIEIDANHPAISGAIFSIPAMAIHQDNQAAQ